MKVICAPKDKIPSRLEKDCEYFSLYSHSGRENVHHIARDWYYELRKINISPSFLIWDFVTISLCMSAADLVCPRSSSADGWTRVINLKIYLYDPEIWNTQKIVLEKAFRFLTGDVWKLEFMNGGVIPPRSIVPLKNEADCISLLSGGMDSLIGGINLVFDGLKPCFVSQEAKGDKNKQIEFTNILLPGQIHFQWKNPIGRSARNEDSTRGRSIVFLAYALLATSTISKEDERSIDIYVPENGFISLNIALNPGRLGSLSTKTTHPVFLGLIQEVWDNVGINVRVKKPFQFKTKGEMLIECKRNNEKLLTSLISNTTSCGKYSRSGYMHCGRCVPCLVRRASFFKAKITDFTKYKYMNLNDKKTMEKAGGKDLRAVASAYLNYKNKGIERFIGGSLSFSPIEDRKKYSNVVENGLKELGDFLKEKKVL